MTLSLIAKHSTSHGVSIHTLPLLQVWCILWKLLEAVCFLQLAAQRQHVPLGLAYGISCYDIASMNGRGSVVQRLLFAFPTAQGNIWHLTSLVSRVSMVQVADVLVGCTTICQQSQMLPMANGQSPFALSCHGPRAGC